MAHKISAKVDPSQKHEHDVNVLLYANGVLYSAADDGKIKAWTDDLKLITEVQAHPCSVFCMTASEDKLYSCSNDGSIKTWTLKDLKEIKTIYQGESEMWRVWYSDGILYAGDDQGVVRSFKDDKLYSMFNLLEPVKDMVIKDMIMFTVRDLDVVVTEIRPGIAGDKGNYGVRCTLMGRAPLCLAGDKLCVSSRGGKDIIIHENNPEHQYKEISETKDAHELIINSLYSSQRGKDIFLYSGGWDKTLKEWQLNNGKLDLKNSCKVDICINTIATNGKDKVYVAGGDGLVLCIS